MNHFINRVVYFIKRISIFFVGGGVLAIASAILIYSIYKYNTEFVDQLMLDDIREFMKNPAAVYLETFFHLYLIATVLFLLLPAKIKSAGWGMRSIFFVIFYGLCVMIYFVL